MPNKSTANENTYGTRVCELCEENGITIYELYRKILKYYDRVGEQKKPALSTFYTWINKGRLPTKICVMATADIFSVTPESLQENVTYVDLTTLPQECLKNVKAVESTVVLPTGRRMRVVSVKEGIAIPEGDGCSEWK